ncbi:MAG: DNA-directed RNA polymerase subunit omega [Chthoniobacterales bacterium]
MNALLLKAATAVVPDNEILVNMVRLRVRQLINGHRPLIAAPPAMGFADISLSEIAQGKLTFEKITDAPALADATPAVIAFPAAKSAKKRAA